MKYDRTKKYVITVPDIKIDKKTLKEWSMSMADIPTRAVMYFNKPDNKWFIDCIEYDTTFEGSANSVIKEFKEMIKDDELVNSIGRVKIVSIENNGGSNMTRRKSSKKKGKMCAKAGCRVHPIRGRKYCSKHRK